MIQTYPEIPQEQIDRQNQVWLSCDVSTCDAEVEITSTLTSFTRQSGSYTISGTTAPMPEGWATTDVDGNALRGAADFCPKHADRVNTYGDNPVFVTEGNES